MAVRKLKRKPKRLRASNSLSQIITIVALCALAVFTFASRQPSVEASNKPIVVAERDIVTLPAPLRTIRPGEKLSSINFTTVELPRGNNSSHYIDSIEAYKNSFAKTSLPKMLPIPREALTFESVNSNMVVEGIPEGMRAITVSVDSESAIEGWARSGSYVDVILIRNTLDANPDLESKIIAENVRILSAGRSTTPSGSRTTASKAPATVTLLTSQEEALKIKTASGLGKITFALRGIGDESPSRVVAMNQRRLLGDNTSSKPKRYNGYAKDSQGREFVLTTDKQWIRSQEKEISKRSDDESSTRAQLNSIDIERE